MQIHHLVSNPEVVHLLLDLGITSGGVGRGGRSISVHVLVHLLLLLALQNLGPSFDSCLQATSQLLFDRLI